MFDNLFTDRSRRATHVRVIVALRALRREFPDGVLGYSPAHVRSVIDEAIAEHCRACNTPPDVMSDAIEAIECAAPLPRVEGDSERPALRVGDLVRVPAATNYRHVPEKPDDARIGETRAEQIGTVTAVHSDHTVMVSTVLGVSPYSTDVVLFVGRRFRAGEVTPA